MSDVSRDLKLIAEIRKHERRIRELGEDFKNDLARSPKFLDDYFVEMKLVDDALYIAAEEIIQE